MILFQAVNIHRPALNGVIFHNFPRPFAEAHGVLCLSSIIRLFGLKSKPKYKKAGTMPVFFENRAFARPYYPFPAIVWFTPPDERSLRISDRA